MPLNTSPRALARGSSTSATRGARPGFVSAIYRGLGAAGLSALVLAGETGCGEAGDVTALMPASLPLSPVEPWGRYSDSDCPTADARLASTIPLELFGAEPYVSTFARLLQRYYERHGTQFIGSSARHSAPRYVIDDDADGLQQAAAARFPNLDLDAESFEGDSSQLEELVELVAGFTLRPLLDFVREQARDPTRTHLIVVPTLTRSGRDELAALSVSPALLTRLRDGTLPEAAIWRGVPLPTRFAPLIFLSESAFEAVEHGFGEMGLELLIAHELGHTAGLTHSAVRDNLMRSDLADGEVSCRIALSDDQLAYMASQLEPSTRPPPPLPKAQRRYAEPNALRWQWVRGWLDSSASARRMGY